MKNSLLNYFGILLVLVVICFGSPFLAQATEGNLSLKNTPLDLYEQRPIRCLFVPGVYKKVVETTYRVLEQDLPLEEQQYLLSIGASLKREKGSDLIRVTERDPYPDSKIEIKHLYSAGLMYFAMGEGQFNDYVVGTGPEGYKGRGEAWRCHYFNGSLDGQNPLKGRVDCYLIHSHDQLSGPDFVHAILQEGPGHLTVFPSEEQTKAQVEQRSPRAAGTAPSSDRTFASPPFPFFPWVVGWMPPPMHQFMTWMGPPPMVLPMPMPMGMPFKSHSPWSFAFPNWQMNASGFGVSMKSPPPQGSLNSTPSPNPWALRPVGRQISSAAVLGNYVVDLSLSEIKEHFENRCPSPELQDWADRYMSLLEQELRLNQESGRCESHPDSTWPCR